MQFLDNLKNRTLLLVPSSVKRKVLDYIEKNNLFFPFKLMTLKEVRDSLTFSYDENAICYLQKKYKIKRSVAQIYLRHLYYVTDSYNENMNLLRQIKEELEQAHLLYKKENFTTYLKTCDVIVYGYTVFTKEEKYWIKKIKEYTTVQWIQEEMYPLDTAYLCYDVEEELKNVFEEISSLLKKGIPLSHIYLTNVTGTLYPKIQRMARNYHIPLDNEPKFLYTTPLYQQMKKMILRGEELSTLPYLEELLAKVNGIQKLEAYDLEEILDDAAKEINIQEEQTNCLRIEPLLNNVYAEEDYVFILNANASFLPVTYKDEDFLYDAIKPSILETTTEKNQLAYEGCKNAIAQIKNKKVFLIEEDEGTLYYPSVLLDDVCIKKQEKIFVSHASHKQNRKNLTLLLDEKRKYGITSSSLEILKQNYPCNYFSYHATFTGLSPEKLKSYLEGKLQLSYSAFQSFYACSFQYYLEYILRLSPYQETFATFLGNLFHLILKESPKDISSFISSYLENNPKKLSKKEWFYLQWNQKDMEEVFAFWFDLKKHSSFTIEETEKKIILSLPSQYETSFVGIIDKKWKNEKENTCILVDYKTGSTSFDLRDAFYGLGMQLPIYYYLVKKENKDEKVIGFYLQSLLEKNFKYKNGKTVKQQKRESLKLNGYTLAQEKILETLDTTYHDSQFIKGLKVGGNGFYAYSKILSEKEMDALYHLVEEKIENMIAKIESASFAINPKKIRGENRSCKFCPYRSICFRKSEDIEEMEEIADIHFLGGDQDA